MGQSYKARITRVIAMPRVACGICLFVYWTLAGADVHAALTLSEVEHLSLGTDPQVAAEKARADALRDNAVADGQLPDPKLTMGVFNLPLDDFSFSDEPTTQWRTGVHQAFPRGRTLRYKRKQTEWRASAEDARAENEQRSVLRDVRLDFLELYYHLEAYDVVSDSRDLFAQLVDITQAHYASGRVSQQDVIQAQLELSRLDDRATRIQSEVDISRAALAKWINGKAWLPVARSFPELSSLPGKESLQSLLSSHPIVVSESARVESANQGVEIAREQYKPGWQVGVEYRKRFGDDPDGSDRSDMMAAMVTVDLPLFPEKRQDRRLAASQREVEAARFTRSDQLRELKEMLDADYARWIRLGERQSLYQSQLLRDATANAQASLKSYQSGITEFTTLMRARITELDVRLDDLRVRVDRAKAQARLLYLLGEGQ